jgi:hypothetical protein
MNLGHSVFAQLLHFVPQRQLQLQEEAMGEENFGQIGILRAQWESMETNS